MAFIEPNPIQATNKADGQGTITIVKLLTPEELDGKCDMYAKVIIPPLCSIGVKKQLSAQVAPPSVRTAKNTASPTRPKRKI